MEKMAENLKKKAEHLEQISSSTDMALVEMRLQVDTLLTMQQQERLEMQKAYDRATAHWRHITVLSLSAGIISLLVIVCLLFT